MAASILAVALGLPRPETVPAVPVDLDRIAELAAAVQQELQSQEVLAESA